MKIAVGRNIGAVSFHNCSDDCLRCLYKNADDLQTHSQTIKCDKNNEVRIGIMKRNDVVVRICSDEVDDVNSTRCFKQKFVACFSIMELLKTKDIEMHHESQRLNEELLKKDIDLRKALQQQNEENKMAIGKIVTRLSHNLVSLNTRSSQELFALIPQERLTGNIHDQLTTIGGILNRDLNKASSVYLRLIKNCLAMDAEFIAATNSCNTIITGEKKVSSPKRHPLRKVILNVAHAFFVDFKEHNVHVEFGQYKDNALFDYPTFRCALFHIFDNATKYVMPSTSINVEILKDGNLTKIRFIMRSLPIMPDEVESICNDSVSGKMPTAFGLNGHGHGLYITKEMLAMNNAVFKIFPNFSNKGRYKHNNGREYEDNLFEIQMAM